MLINKPPITGAAAGVIRRGLDVLASALDIGEVLIAKLTKRHVSASPAPLMAEGMVAIQVADKRSSMHGPRITLQSGW